MKQKLFIACSIILLLSGCASRSTSPIHFQFISHDVRQTQLRQITRWQARGVLGIRNLSTNKGAVVNFLWNENGNQYQIDFSAALNFVNATLQGKPGSVDFRQGNKHYQAKSIAALMQQQFGWALPVRNLQYWIKGQIAPGQSSETYDQYGHLKTLKQNGWQINYFAYTQVKNQDLPSRLTLINPQFNVRIVIKQWAI